jgi:excisionase family DNA binding protein
MIELLTVQEAAKTLKTTDETVRRWIVEGKLKASKPARKYLISIEAITEFLEVNQMNTPAKTESNHAR